MSQDLRFVARMLWKNPGFMLVAAFYYRCLRWSFTSRHYT